MWLSSLLSYVSAGSQTQVHGELTDNYKNDGKIMQHNIIFGYGNDELSSYWGLTRTGV
jgi:hypothetical protein